MAHEFQVIDSSLLIDAPILALRRDEVVMPGAKTAKREIVEHHGAVAVAAIREAKIALIYQYRHSVRRRLWELPAGLLDIAGESEIEAARRELWEESGLRAERWDVIADLVTSPGFCEEACRVFLARDITEGMRPEGEDEESEMTMRWFDLDQARSMVLRGEIVNSIAVAGILAASEVVAGRQSPRPVDTPFDLRPTSLASRRSGTDLKKI